MNMRNAAVALTALLAAQACGAPVAPPAETTGATSEAGKPGVAEAAPQTVQLSPAALIGRWGDNGDCSKDIVFNADGTFHSYTGGDGRWTLDGERMTMIAQNGAFEVRVSSISENTLMIGNPDGTIGTSQRC